jgi:hypothetical protein
MMSDILDRYFMPVFRWLVLGACIAAALNYVAFWWYWEVRLPAWGAMPSWSETLGARLTLFSAAAALVSGVALFDLLKSLPKIRRRSIVLFSLAVACGVMPYLIGRLLLS